MIGYKIQLGYSPNIIGTHVVTTSDIFQYKKEMGWGKWHDISFIIWLYSNKFGIDISSYSLDDFRYGPFTFTVWISSSDLVKLRNDKLKELGI